MGYVKYTKEQLAERERAQVAIKAARAHLKSIREFKKARKEIVADVRRAAKARLRRIKEDKRKAQQAEGGHGPTRSAVRPTLQRRCFDKGNGVVTTNVLAKRTKR